MAGAVESYRIGSIDRREVLRYLGYAGQELTPEMDGRIDAVVARALAVARPRGCVAVFEVDEDASSMDGLRTGASSRAGGPLVAGSNDPAAALVAAGRLPSASGAAEGLVGGAATAPGRAAARGSDAASDLPVIRLKGAALELRGRSIAEHLAGARAVGVMAVTIGMGVERELRRLSLTDPVAQVIFDSCASTIVERAADAAEASLMAQARERGLHTNSRFSPGYGDLPMETQPALLATLDAQRRLGITLTGTLLMTPTKGVTAVVGVFDAPQPTGHRTCKGCLCYDFCTIRPTGRTCRD